MVRQKVRACLILTIMCSIYYNNDITSFRYTYLLNYNAENVTTCI